MITGHKPSSPHPEERAQPASRRTRGEAVCSPRPSRRRLRRLLRVRARFIGREPECPKAPGVRSCVWTGGPGVEAMASAVMPYLLHAFRCIGVNEYCSCRQETCVRLVSGALLRPQSRPHHLPGVSGDLSRPPAATSAPHPSALEIRAIRACRCCGTGRRRDSRKK